MGWGIQKARLLVRGEKIDTEEKCHTNLVTSGGVRPTSVLGEEALTIKYLFF